MGDHPQKSTGWEFALRLKAFYVALFMTLGVQMPFLPVWFASKGLDAQAIGIVIAVPVMVRILAIPVVTRAADRPDSLRRVIIVTAATATAGFGVLGFVDGIVPIMIAYNLAAVAYSAVMMLADTYALRGLGRLGRAYGPVRLWGSAAFIVSSFGAGAFLAVIVADDLIWLVVATMALATVAAVTLAPPGGDTPGSSAAPPPATRILRDPSFLAAVAAASLVQASHAVYYGFSTIDWQAAGLKGTTIGALWALGVVAEIALFALSARLPAPITPIALLLLGAGGAAVRWAAMALAPPVAALPALQCLHALSFGATHLGALGFVATAAPAGLAATAQGYLVMAIGVAMAVAMAAAGVLYASYGDRAYGVMAVTACAGGVCALIARRTSDKRH